MPEPESRAAPPPRGAGLAAALLLALGASLASWCAAVKSDSYDEPMYILSGYAYWTTGDFSLNREHPPLAKLLLALPLLALDLELPDSYQQRPGIPFAFVFHQPRVDARTIVFLARLPGVVLLVVLGLYVWRWARLAFGWRAGLLALALATTSPPLVAHAAIAGNDFPLAVFSFAALFHAWRWLETGARRSLALAALLLGAALGCKLTALLLLPGIGLAVLVAALRRRRPSLLGWSLVGLLAGGGVLWLLYLGEARTLADARQHVRFRLPESPGRVLRLAWIEDGLQSLFGAERPVPLLGLLKAVDMQLGHAEEGHVTYLRGERSDSGFPSFYVQSWLMKNPVGLTLLLVLGLLTLPRTRRGAVHEILLYGFPLLVFVFFSRARIQLGFTYVLPMVAPLCVAASRVLASAPGDGPPRARRGEALAGATALLLVAAFGYLWFDDKGDSRWIPWVPLVLPAACAAWLVARALRSSQGVALGGPALLLGGWAVVGTLANQPHALAHFNEWVGGRDNGWRYSVVRDDWGQDVATLGRWMAQHGVPHVFYDKYTTGDPEAWGVRFTPTWGRRPEAASGWLAVHVNRLGRKPEMYRWLVGAEPAEILGGTILLYRLEDLPVAPGAGEAPPAEESPAGEPPELPSALEQSAPIRPDENGDG